MVKVPVWDSQSNLRPTPMDPGEASALGKDVVDVSKGIEGLADTLQKLDNRRQTLKAETSLAQAHRQNYQMAATDPDIDNLEEKINNKSDQDIESAAKLIQSPEARNEFTAKASLDVERRNLPAYNLITKRKSQDFKTSLVNANDEDLKTYQEIEDPRERQIMKQQIVDRTAQAVKDGHVNADWARLHVDTAIKHADINQVNNDIALNAESALEHLQKGKDGLYPDISDKFRKEAVDKATKAIAKQGQENNHIFEIAQNQTENQLIDMMGKGALTQDVINDSVIKGINGIRPRPEFVKAATEALQDPFPTDPVPDKYNKLVNDVTDPDSDPIETKLKVLNTRGVTPQQKAHLLNTAMREDPQEGRQSINHLIQDGIQKNKQEIMEASNRVKKEQEDRKSFLRGVTGMFRDHAKDDQHLADLQQDYFNKVQKSKDQDEMMALANDVLNKDRVRLNPKVFTDCPKDGSICMDAKGNKAKVFPGGRIEEI